MGTLTRVLTQITSSDQHEVTRCHSSSSVLSLRNQRPQQHQHLVCHHCFKSNQKTSSGDFPTIIRCITVESQLPPNPIIKTIIMTIIIIKRLSPPFLMITRRLLCSNISSPDL